MIHYSCADLECFVQWFKKYYEAYHVFLVPHFSIEDNQNMGLMVYRVRDDGKWLGPSLWTHIDLASILIVDDEEDRFKDVRKMTGWGEHY